MFDASDWQKSFEHKTRMAKVYKAGSVDVNMLCDHLEATLRELDEIGWRIRAGKQ
jgi:hypothetical protein